MAHILLIDDDDNVRQLLACVLRREGHEITEARDGREGIALQNHRSADVVITDIVMPDMEGLETIGRLLHTTPKLPIIAISGVANARLYLTLSSGIGAKFALEKPIAPHVLAQTVRSALASAA